MNIMVFDVPVDSGGGLTILNQYYEKASKDKKNNWYFVLSVIELEDTENIKVLNYPWTKKSWFHRLFFDIFVAPFLVSKYKIDKILSLQNVVIPFTNVPQTIYLHQPLPFTNIKFKLIENFKFWMYQNIISKIIFSSIKKAECIIVQTQWMARACCKKTGVTYEKIKVQKPDILLDDKRYDPIKDNNKFIYPAGPLDYKNHRILVKAAKRLREKGIINYKIYLTLKGDENDRIKNLYEEITKNKLPIVFRGSLSLSEVYEYYCHSKLLFPSYIETFGLPLLEARLHESPIIASDCEFSREILEGYEKASFFDPFDDITLAKLMEKAIK